MIWVEGQRCGRVRIHIPEIQHQAPHLKVPHGEDEVPEHLTLEASSA